MSTRRSFLGRAFGASSAFFAARGLSAQVMKMQMPAPNPAPPPAQTIRPARQPFFWQRLQARSTYWFAERRFRRRCRAI